jgi:histidine decarboxylase
MTTSPITAGEFDLRNLADLSNTAINVSAVFQTLIDQATSGQPTSIGFPGAVDIDYSAVLPLFGRLWNNVGDPSTPPGGTAHTNALERAVIDWCADVLALPRDDRWGYVTAGGTEGNLAALHAAHRRFPNAIAYFSRSAHYSIRKVVDIVGIPSQVVDTDDFGEMNYKHLDMLVARFPDRPAIVVITAGTTMTEAIDDAGQVLAILQAHGVRNQHLHVDAALAGIPLALDGLLRLDDQSGIDSAAISGHKFFGTPVPCGVVLMRESTRRQAQHIAYTATLDTTVTGSRSGQAAALLWYAIATYGRDGHRARTAAARELAAYTTQQLTAMNWPAWRHPDAFTVVLRTPDSAVTKKWLLATDGASSHTICMPGITKGQIDAFLSDLEASRTVRHAPRVPSQRCSNGAMPT